MELLAGEDDMIAEVGEHERIVSKFKKTDVVCDVFGGVGPFAIPAAKNVGCVVFCNDLNPVSYKYLEENIKANKDAIAEHYEMPVIHCHCFAHKEDDTEEDVIKRAESYLGGPIGNNLIAITKVRGVSPKKEMLCISFRLPKDIAFADPKASQGTAAAYILNREKRTCEEVASGTEEQNGEDLVKKHKVA
ncbi:tRNA(m(1)G37)methyltransferase [Phlyctochytrium bullatum]|nr:tRNA(m(1)G37)methyltransferase [Phlyctochytrium bullatum]